MFCQTHQLYTGIQNQLRPGPLLGSHQIWAIDQWPCQLLHSHGVTTTVTYDKPTPIYAYVQTASNISIWLETPLLSGDAIYTRGTAGKLGDVTTAHTTSLARPKVTKVTSPTPNYPTAKVLVQIRRSAFMKSVTRVKKVQRARTVFIWLKTVQWWTLWEFANEAAGTRRGGEYPDHLIRNDHSILAISCFRRDGRLLPWGYWTSWALLHRKFSSKTYPCNRQKSLNLIKRKLYALIYGFSCACHESIRRSAGTAPHILSVGTKYGVSASRPAHFNPGEWTHGTTEYVTGWAQALDKRYIPCSYWDSNQRLSQSLYRLRYAGSENPDTFAVWSATWMPQRPPILYDFMIRQGKQFSHI